MIVIPDTGPLNYLVLIGSVDVLKPLFGCVIIPEAVERELRVAGAPEAVRSWITQAPAWLELLPDPPPDPALGFLDPGESAALTLAQLLNADQLLIDYWAGRAEAARRGLRVTGTLGVLADAHRAGLLDFEGALARLHHTNFRLDPELEEQVRQLVSRGG